MRTRIQDVIAIGINSGRLKRDIDADLGAQAITAVVEDAARKVLTRRPPRVGRRRPVRRC